MVWKVVSNVVLHESARSSPACAMEAAPAAVLVPAPARQESLDVLGADAFAGLRRELEIAAGARVELERVATQGTPR